MPIIGRTGLAWGHPALLHEKKEQRLSTYHLSQHGDGLPLHPHPHQPNPAWAPSGPESNPWPPKAPGLPSKAVISSSTVSLTAVTEGRSAGMRGSPLLGPRADLQNWPRPGNFTDRVAEGSLVWAFATRSKMCREGR